MEIGNKFICINSYCTSFFDLAHRINNANMGDVVTITYIDKTFLTVINDRTHQQLYLPQVIFNKYFKEVEDEPTNV